MEKSIVILGLGSNLGHRLQYLRRAVQALESHAQITLVNYSRLYLTKAIVPENTPADWDIDYFNMVIKIETTLEPLTLMHFNQHIEREMGRDSGHEIWSPRIIDIDILSWEDRIIETQALNIPHQHLLERNFAIAPLIEIHPLWQHPKYPEMDLYSIINKMPALTVLPYRLKGTQLMGIINITPESMSGPHFGYSLESIQDQFISLVNGGAEVIDIGAESTRPNAKAINAEAEWQRLRPILEHLNKMLANKNLLIHPKISIDTYHAETVQRLMPYPVNMINDIYGIETKEMLPYLRENKLKYIFMHHCGKAGDQYLDKNIAASQQVIQYGQKQVTQLVQNGLCPSQLIYDLGFGFGKYPFQIQEMIQSIDLFKTKFEILLLIGHSRKAFAMPSANALPAIERDLETASLSQYLAQHGIDYLRVHDTESSSRLIQMNSN
jgi:2-amino-4-hydroxy-6-hydroxymethyldihydropteridine diphosphokinase / dihydropteroate synthase